MHQEGLSFLRLTNSPILDSQFAFSHVELIQHEVIMSVISPLKFIRSCNLINMQIDFNANCIKTCEDYYYHCSVYNIMIAFYREWILSGEFITGECPLLILTF
jgi:hypothetical protein